MNILNNIKRNSKLDDTKNILQIETSFNSRINSNIIINSQINQTNIYNSIKNSTIKSDRNTNNLNLFQIPKNIYKNYNFEEKSQEKIQIEESQGKIVRNNYYFIYLIFIYKLV